MSPCIRRDGSGCRIEGSKQVKSRRRWTEICSQCSRTSRAGPFSRLDSTDRPDAALVLCQDGRANAHLVLSAAERRWCEETAALAKAATAVLAGSSVNDKKKEREKRVQEREGE